MRTSLAFPDCNPPWQTSEISIRLAAMRMLPHKFFAPVVAVLPLPGSPRYAGSSRAVINAALADLDEYAEAGADVVVFENSHDLPYIKPPLDPHGVTLMKRIGKEARKRFNGPIGIQLLEAANESALEIACEADLDFLRVEGYVFAHIGGAGLIEGCAGQLLRRRAQLGCKHLRIFGDVNKKHCSHALTGDLDITDVVKQAEFFLVDGVIVTGPRTGQSPELKELKRVKESAKVPVVIGSGMTSQNISRYIRWADGFIVGSALREDGKFLGRLDSKRLRTFVRAFHEARDHEWHS
jgi:membrane complex biogenesis BtpA family protein